MMIPQIPCPIQSVFGICQLDFWSVRWRWLDVRERRQGPKASTKGWSTALLHTPSLTLMRGDAGGVVGQNWVLA